MASKIRIATVKATGHRYLVIKLDIPKQGEVTVQVWGECTGYKGLASKHNGTKSFKRSEVEITEEPKTAELLKALFKQSIQAKRAAGAQIHVSRTGRTATNYGTNRAETVEEALSTIAAAVNFGDEANAAKYTEKAKAALEAGKVGFYPSTYAFEIAANAESKGFQSVAAALLDIAAATER